MPFTVSCSPPFDVRDLGGGIARSGFSNEEGDHCGKKYQEGGKLVYRHFTTGDEAPLITAKTF